MNEAIELHDTRLISLLWNGTELHLRLHAYVLRSSGEVGVDTTEGWWRDYEWIISSAQLSTVPQLPWWILDGSLSCDRGRFTNLVPLPGPITGPIELQLVSNEGTELQISGTNLLMLPLNVGDFEGMVG